ncbi:GGDEF domain-containing protein, partial [Pseudomonas donghuensis]|nr:GGDEF domain-containing protein [Pseudomonas donghuensis]
HARQQQASLAVAMIDIDHFKRINDLYGHLAGDEVLCHCVRQLQQRLRKGDSLGRYGGEEFLLLLPGSDRSGAMAALQGL